MSSAINTDVQPDMIIDAPGVFLIDEEYACRIPGVTLRYFNIIIREYLVKSNKYKIEECLDEDDEKIAKTWIVEPEQLVNFLDFYESDVMTASVKEKNNVWIIPDSENDDIPRGAEFFMAKVLKKNMKSVRVSLESSGLVQTVPFSRLLWFANDNLDNEISEVKRETRQRSARSSIASVQSIDDPGSRRLSRARISLGSIAPIEKDVISSRSSRSSSISNPGVLEGDKVEVISVI